MRAAIDPHLHPSTRVGDQVRESPDGGERRDPEHPPRGQEIREPQGCADREEGVEQIEAGENGRIGEHMAEFVPDHTLEFGFVEQMDNRTIEIDLVPEAQAGKEFRARCLSIQFLLPDQVDRSGILGKARSAEDALSQSHQ